MRELISSRRLLEPTRCLLVVVSALAVDGVVFRGLLPRVGAAEDTVLRPILGLACLLAAVSIAVLIGLGRRPEQQPGPSRLPYRSTLHRSALTLVMFVVLKTVEESVRHHAFTTPAVSARKCLFVALVAIGISLGLSVARRVAKRIVVRLLRTAIWHTTPRRSARLSQTVWSARRSVLGAQAGLRAPPHPA
jgi:hypothetical protein